MARSTSYSTDLADCGEQRSRLAGRSEGWAVCDNARPVGKGMNSIVNDLRQKFAERTWNETFQLVRRCMEKNRSLPQASKLMVKSMERLQEVVNVSSMSTMKSRLEMIARQQGMGFHITEATCYLTADLFYLEVALLPCGRAEDVKVARHGGSPLPSRSFLQLLRAKHFEEFSRKLEALFTQYNIPGDKDHKFDLFTCLQYLWQDLQHISDLNGVPKDKQYEVDLINKGQFGRLIAGEEDMSPTIHFHISQSGGLETAETRREMVQAAHVTVGSTPTSYKLQAASALLQPAKLDSEGHAVFLLPHEAPRETLQACFLLKLKPSLPVMLTFVTKLQKLTDVTIPEDNQQMAPLHKLLFNMSARVKSQEEMEVPDAYYTVPLSSGVTHRYVFPGVVWEAPDQRGMLLDSVPFTHPAQIPAMLEVLRHQCTINTLLMTCVTSQHAAAGSLFDLHYEVLPESEPSFSVTLQRPDVDSLAVLLVNICDSHQIRCTLCGAGIEDGSLDEYISDVMKRSMSIPETLNELHRKLGKIPKSLPPPCHQANNNLLLSPGATGSETSSNLPHSAPAADKIPPGSACNATSGAQPLHEINIRATDSPFQACPVDAAPDWSSVSHLPERV